MNSAPPAADDFESIRRDIEESFRAASRRGAVHAGQAARELHLDALAERFFAEAAALARSAGEPAAPAGERRRQPRRDSP